MDAILGLDSRPRDSTIDRNERRGTPRSGSGQSLLRGAREPLHARDGSRSKESMAAAARRVIHGADDDQWLEWLQFLRDSKHAKRLLDELGEDERLASDALNSSSRFLQIVEFRRVPGLGAEIANLLQAENELENMRDVQLSSERTKPDGSFFLGLSVGGALCRRQVKSDHRGEFGRQIVEDLVAPATQLHSGTSGCEGRRPWRWRSNSPGATKSRTESKSSRRFSSGVPVNAQERRAFERFDDGGDVGFRHS